MSLRRAVSTMLVCLLAAGLLLGTAAGCQRGSSEGLSAWTGDVEVRTLYGPVKGRVLEEKTMVWKGVPYARPPEGDLRWKAPRDPDPWETPLQAYDSGPECTQYDLSGQVRGSEDCLYLNIWRPKSGEDALPVYFWIHGGGNAWEAASDDRYDGANLAAAANMVVVGANYRLGLLGWFACEALRSDAAGSELDNSGNYGTLDLIKALTWVQDNIAAFGGDPEKVTVAGESAGAFNIFSLLISPQASGLFQGAIAQSGLPVSATMKEGEEAAREVILKLLVSDGTAADRAAAEGRLDAMSDQEVGTYLRGKTSRQLLAACPTTSGTLSFPFIFTDGTVIPAAGFGVLETGDYPNKVPLIIGCNREETKAFFAFADYSVFGSDAMYQEVTSVTSGIWKARGVDGMARKLASHAGQPPVYAYELLWGAADESGRSVLPGQWGRKLGSCHGLDVSFFFGNWTFYSLDKMVFDEQNRPGREALSATMQGYLAQFVRTGNPCPDGSGLPAWTPWSNPAGGPKCVLLDADLNTASIAMSTSEMTEAGLLAGVDDDTREVLDDVSAAMPFWWPR